jgi:2-oxo-3-hexenedioate decarboxylase
MSDVEPAASAEFDARVDAGLDRLFDARQRMLSEGARHLGWKMAFGAPAMLERLQLSAPAPGFLTDKTLFESGATLPLLGWTAPVVEFEIALHLGVDVPAGTGPAGARAAVAAIGPAIELADVDLALSPDLVADIVAGNIFHRGVILGEPDSTRSGVDLAGLVATIDNGAAISELTDLEALTGDYGMVVATVADLVSRHGERLKAGDVIIGGSVVSPLPVPAPTTFVYTLSGFPPLTVRAG